MNGGISSEDKSLMICWRLMINNLMNDRFVRTHAHMRIFSLCSSSRLLCGSWSRALAGAGMGVGMGMGMGVGMGFRYDLYDYHTYLCNMSSIIG